MNRRGFFGRFLGLAAAPAAIVELPKPQPEFPDLREHAFEKMPLGASPVVYHDTNTTNAKELIRRMEKPYARQNSLYVFSDPITNLAFSLVCCTNLTAL